MVGKLVRGTPSQSNKPANLFLTLWQNSKPFRILQLLWDVQWPFHAVLLSQRGVLVLPRGFLWSLRSCLCLGTSFKLCANCWVVIGQNQRLGHHHPLMSNHRANGGWMVARWWVNVGMHIRKQDRSVKFWQPCCLLVATFKFNLIKACTSGEGCTGTFIFGIVSWIFRTISLGRSENTSRTATM